MDKEDYSSFSSEELKEIQLAFFAARDENEEYPELQLEMFDEF